MGKIQFTPLLQGPEQWEKDFKEDFIGIEISAFGIAWFVLSVNLVEKGILFGMVFFFIGIWWDDEE